MVGVVMIPWRGLGDSKSMLMPQSNARMLNTVATWFCAQASVTDKHGEGTRRVPSLCLV